MVNHHDVEGFTMFRKRNLKAKSIKVEDLDYQEADHKRKPSLGDTAGTFFSQKHPHITSNQPVNVNVNIEIDTGESDLASCLKSCFGCFGS